MGKQKSKQVHNHSGTPTRTANESKESNFLIIMSIGVLILSFILNLTTPTNLSAQADTKKETKPTHETNKTNTSKKAKNQTTELGLIVEPIYPKNQDKEVQGYFSVTHPTKIKQTLTFKLTNPKSTAMTINTTVMNGILSPNRTIQYVDVTKLEYSELFRSEYALTRYAKLDQSSVTLKPHESKKVHLHVNISNFNGTVLGGVAFSEVDTWQPKQKNTVGVITKKNLIYGVQLNVGKERKLQITVKEPYVKQYARGNFYLRVPIKFNTNRVIKDMKYTYSVKNSEGRVIFKDDKYSTFNVSPKTTVEFNIIWAGAKLSLTEKYTIDIKFIDKDTKQEYIFHKPISLDDDSLRKYQTDKEEDNKIKTILVTDSKTLYTLYLIIIIILSLVILILLLLLAWRRRKKKQEQEEVDKTNRGTSIYEDYDYDQEDLDYRDIDEYEDHYDEHDKDEDDNHQSNRR